VIVADTNLVAYLLTPGERTEAAEAVRARDSEWVAPPLWRSEFGSVLVQHLRAGSLDQATALAAWEDAEALFSGREQAATAASILDVALRHTLSAYDAEFVALAEGLGVPLVTGDRRVLKGCPGVAVSIEDFARDTDERSADAPDR
jgi:predicted nucleic acid-binding protein